MKKILDTLFSKEKSKKSLIIIFLIYISCNILITCFHEQWFDECNAWQIAKYASYKEMFTELARFDGHPPLYWLILSIPAKLGLPFVISAKTIAVLSSCFAIYLLLFKSPLPIIAKATLPFSYFVFYQYSIQTRPYSFFMIAMFLTAIFYNDKNKHPYKFVFSLIFLSLTTAYGLLIACVLALIWTVRIFKKKGILYAFKNVKNDKRTHSLFMLLICGCLIASIIVSDGSTSLASDDYSSVSTAYKLFLSFIIFIISPFETTFSNIETTDNSMIEVINTLIADKQLLFTLLVPLVLLGAALIAVLIIISKKINLKISEIILVPLAMGLFSGFFFFIPHHFGIFFIYYIFLAWIGFDNKNMPAAEKSENAEKSLKLILPLKLFFAFALISSVYMSVCSGISDIKYPYNSAKETVNYIYDNNLQNLKIAYLTAPKQKDGEIYKIENGSNSVFEAYAGESFINMPELPHYEWDFEITENELKNYPDMFISTVNDLNYYYGSDGNCPEYIVLKSFDSYNIWKNTPPFVDGTYQIFIRTDLLESNYPNLESEQPEIKVGGTKK